MKVSKTGGTPATGPAKKTGKASDRGSSFADALKGTSDVDAPEATQSTGGVNAVDAILAIQQTADATDHRSRGLMMDYGNDLLDRLEQIRVAILTGSISKDRLQDLAHRLRENKAVSDDPQLNDLIGDIELRVEVEIAKLTR